jgi:hypothetical protein
VTCAGGGNYGSGSPRRSALPSIAVVLPLCREPPLGATGGHKPGPKFVAAGHVPCGSRRHGHHGATGSLVRSGFVMRTALSENQLFQGHALVLSWCLLGEWSYHLSSFLPMR